MADKNTFTFDEALERSNRPYTELEAAIWRETLYLKKHHWKVAKKYGLKIAEVANMRADGLAALDLCPVYKYATEKEKEERINKWHSLPKHVWVDSDFESIEWYEKSEQAFLGHGEYPERTISYRSH